VHPNVELLDSFYSAFAAGDHETMASAYADTATFSDPVFPKLDAEEARAMWKMFCTSGNEIRLTYTNVQADDLKGSVEWEAVYRFPKTGREVNNRIQADFRFQDGKIVEHRDHFDLYAWMRMALGPVGVAAGWTPLLQSQVRKQAHNQLHRFMSKNS
jgi:limonene-1,2-epoxide hydrolase